MAVEKYEILLQKISSPSQTVFEKVHAVLDFRSRILQGSAKKQFFVNQIVL